MTNFIIQWNCRGFNANRDEIKNFLCRNPIVCCLQETQLRDPNSITTKQYKPYSAPPTFAIDGKTIGGVSVLVRKDTPHRPIVLNARLQAVAVSNITQDYNCVFFIYST